MSETETTKPGIKARVAEELKKYALISAYLFVCFAVILLYQSSVEAGDKTLLVSLGVALAKALILGKFILIGEAMGVGKRISGPTLLHRVAWRTVAMMAVLLVFKFFEEWIVSLFHGEGLVSVINELTAAPWINLAAPVLLMTLILIPLIAAAEFDRALGERGLKGLLLDRSESA